MARTTPPKCYYNDKWVDVPVITTTTATTTATTTINTTITASNIKSLSKSFSVLTYNTFFGPYNDKLRQAAICQILKDHNADFICLQEITPRFLRILLKESFIQSSYEISATLESNLCSWPTNYFCVMLAKKGLVNAFEILKLPSNMGRDLIIAKATLGGGKQLVIATVHLESSANAKTRAQQLTEITNYLNNNYLSNNNNNNNNNTTVIVTGDFNFCQNDSDERKGQVFFEHFTDVWKTLRPSEGGWTEDTDINTMRFNLKNIHHKKRFDVIMLSNNNINNTNNNTNTNNNSNNSSNNKSTTTTTTTTTATSMTTAITTAITTALTTAITAAITTVMTTAIPVNNYNNNDNNINNNNNYNYKPEKIELVGTKCIDIKTATFPSDHFGLVASFSAQEY